MGKFLLSIIMAKRFAGQRRIIGIVLLLAAAAVQRVICDPDIGAAVPVLASTCSAVGPTMAWVLTALGGWAGVVGIIGSRRP